MNNKEMQAYNLGLQRALDIIQGNHDGVRALEQEISYRNIKGNIPKSVLSQREIRLLAREYVKPTLLKTSVAMAQALKEIKLPATMIKEYLVRFNGLCDIYSVDQAKYESDCKTLDNDFNLQEISQSYMALTLEEEERLKND